MSKLLERVVRGLPAIPGKLRIARLLLGELHGAAEIKDRFGFSYHVPDLREPLGFHLLVNGAYEPEIQDLIHRTLRPGNVFIDVGANIGTFTIPAAKWVGETGQVIAIEASPDVFAVLQSNVSTNDARNVHLIAAAAGERDEETEFFPAPVDHFGMGSRAPQFDARSIKIPSVTLDSLVEKFELPSVDLIKIDVEGFEFDVLKGAARLLTNENPLLVFEFIDWAEARLPVHGAGAAQRLLMDLNFKIWRASEYPHGSPIAQPLTVGGEMLVACR